MYVQKYLVLAKDHSKDKEEIEPNKFDSLAIVILDRRDCQKIPERSAILLVVQEPSAVAFALLHCISNFINFFLVRLWSLKKTAAIQKKKSPTKPPSAPKYGIFSSVELRCKSTFILLCPI